MGIGGMTVWWFAFVLGCLGAIAVGFVWVLTVLERLQAGQAEAHDARKAFDGMVEEDVDRFFNKEFREELRNRGRMQFEKIIDENAMFLKQDLDMTVSQLNEFMKKEIVARLNTEFDAYAKAMQEAQELTEASLQRTAEDVNARHAALTQALEKEVAERKAALIQQFEAGMAQVVEHYVLQALSEQLDLKAQLPYIIRQMEASKADIVKDMQL
jgi:hypothetical protein